MAKVTKTEQITVCDRCGKRMRRGWKAVKCTLIFENDEGSEDQHVLQDVCPVCTGRILNALKKRGGKEEDE